MAASSARLGEIDLGAWGVGILENDAACDAYDGYLRLYDARTPPDDLLTTFRRVYADEMADEDDGPSFRFGLAKAMWECGTLTTELLAEVEQIAAGDGYLECWEEYASARKAAVDRFIASLSTPRASPRQPKRHRFKPAVYAPGDCLSIRLSDGDYGAAIVLAVDNDSDPQQGLTLLGVLRYKSPTPPGPADFETRDWLILTHHSYDGRLECFWASARDHKKQAQGLEVVCQTAIRDTDPRTSNVYGGWYPGLQVERQHAWDRGERD